MTARLYCQVVGVLLLLLGFVGIFWPGLPNIISVNEPAEISLHFVLGALAAYAGFSRGGYGRLAMLYTKVFGIVYVILAIIGFIVPDLVPGIIHLDLGCNVAHLVLGIWGIYVGYFAPQARGAAPVGS